MSRRPPQQNGLKLPRQLQQELGLDLNSEDGKRKRFGAGGIGRRKERRKTERVEKKVERTTGSVRRVNKSASTAAAFRVADEDDENSESEEEQKRIIRPTAVERPTRGQPEVSKPPERKLKSILKPRTQPTLSASSSDASHHKRSTSPGLVLDRSSKSFRDRAAQDDAEIAALEKRLGLKAKRLPKSFDEDGLGDLLEGLDGGDESKKRKKEVQDWLEVKRRKVAVEDESDEESEHLGSEQDDESDLEADILLEGDSEGLDCDKKDIDGVASAEEEAVEKPPLRIRENPYAAPVSGTMTVTTKYIPPSLRKATKSEAESLQQLHRQLQGYLNKLSEANLLSILAEVEKLYQTNARQDVTSKLIDLLLSLFCDPSVLQNTFVILHASFVAAVYKLIGTDFGAEFISQLVHRFEGFHKSDETSSEKQGVNLISLLAHLYTFRVIGSNLVFDHIRNLLETLSETNAELLLRIVRDAGPQLRQDDPSSLKDIVLLMQNSAAKVQAEGTAISVRTKFMMETIVDLKNNKLKTEIASSGVASEHITRMRKVLGTLSSRNLRASEPLRISLSDVKNADKRGKWWLIGASWKEQEKADELASAPSDDPINGSDGILGGEEADLLMLARQHRMNTAVRRAIFIAIMSANDYKDAHLRLLKLRLKRSQEQEIPRVLMHCASAEEKYNPFYTLIAKTICVDKRMKTAFKFGLWDFFKRIREEGDDLDSDDEDRREEVPLKEIVNTARMFGCLIADGTMSLSVLKTLNLTLLKEQAMMLVEILLIVVISKSQEGVKGAHDEDRLAMIFGKCRDTPQMIGGLRHFLKKVVRHTDLASSKSEARLVSWGCGVAIDTLKVVSSSHSAHI